MREKLKLSDGHISKLFSLTSIERSMIGVQEIQETERTKILYKYYLVSNTPYIFATRKSPMACKNVSNLIMRKSSSKSFCLKIFPCHIKLSGCFITLLCCPSPWCSVKRTESIGGAERSQWFVWQFGSMLRQGLTSPILPRPVLMLHPRKII